MAGPSPRAAAPPAPRARFTPSRLHASPPPSPHAQEDEKSLRKLLGKVKASAESGDKDAIKAHSAKEEAALHAIVDKYKPSAADVAALFAWRHSHEF